MGTSIISVSDPKSVLHQAQYRDYTLDIKTDGLGSVVYAARDGEGKVSSPVLPERLEISFDSGRHYVPLELRVE